MVRPKDKKEEKEKYAQWKQNLPIMYDWIMNHPLTWPSQSCRQAPQKPCFTTPTIYFSTLVRVLELSVLR